MTYKKKKKHTKERWRRSSSNPLWKWSSHHRCSPCCLTARICLFFWTLMDQATKTTPVWGTRFFVNRRVFPLDTNHQKISTVNTGRIHKTSYEIEMLHLDFTPMGLEIFAAEIWVVKIHLMSQMLIITYPLYVNSMVFKSQNFLKMAKHLRQTSYRSLKKHSITCVGSLCRQTRKHFISKLPRNDFHLCLNLIKLQHHPLLTAVGKWQIEVSFIEAACVVLIGH